MKVTTNPDTGVTTCELEKPDRNKLAAAKTVLVKVAVAIHGTRQGDAATRLADAIGSYMTADAVPDPPAEKQPEKPGK